jgi:mannose-1-phosphate guanylyltransferase
MVLTAGLGTRLRPLTDRLPKPACPVVNRPLLAYAFALLKGAGLREVAINTHHLADLTERAARAEARALELALHVSREPVLLGTGGGIAAAAAWLAGETFFVLNGDFLFDVDLAAALAAHRRSGAQATLVTQPLPQGSPHRPVYASPEGGLAVIPGAQPPPGARPLHFTGVQILEPDILRGLELRPSGVFETGYRFLLDRGARVRVHEDRGAWRDLGTPASYLTANLEVARGDLPLARFAALGPLAAVDPGAIVEGLVEDSVVGSGARVARGAEVRRSVVLPETEVAAGESLDGVIAAGELRLAVAPI